MRLFFVCAFFLLTGKHSDLALNRKLRLKHYDDIAHYEDRFYAAEELRLRKFLEKHNVTKVLENERHFKAMLIWGASIGIDDFNDTLFSRYGEDLDMGKIFPLLLCRFYSSFHHPGRRILDTQKKKKSRTKIQCEGHFL